MITVVVTGETEEDIMTRAVEHNMKIHGKTKTDIVEMGEKLKGFIYTLY
jgi:predicted small metal-binding protein